MVWAVFEVGIVVGMKLQLEVRAWMSLRTEHGLVSMVIDAA
jgi:hypothetical protein